MKLLEYQKRSARTRPDLRGEEESLNCALGMAGESGELLDVLKKKIFHGHYAAADEYRAKMIDELGDFIWYYAWFLAIVGVDADVASKDRSRGRLLPEVSAAQAAMTLNTTTALVTRLLATSPNDCYRTLRDVKDVCKIYWLWEQLVTLLGLTPTEIFEYNTEKLTRRYPEGFSKEASQNRPTT